MTNRIRRTLPANPFSQAHSLRVSDLVLEQLSNWGVTHLYGVAGDAILALMDSIGKQSRIRYIAARHEASAAFMAAAEAKQTGHIGVCIGTSGPGLVNMLNGIADAAFDQVPLLVITGQLPTNQTGTNQTQYIEQQQMISPLAIRSEHAADAQTVLQILHDLLVTAYSKRGVVHLSVSKDVFAALAERKPRMPLNVLFETTAENVRSLDQAIGMLQQADRPLIVIGEGAHRAKQWIPLVAEIFQAPIVETLGAKGIVSDTHPFYIGGIGDGGTEEAQQLCLRADCVLNIGANWWPEGYFEQYVPVISVDISAENIERHPQSACGLVGDAGRVVQQIVEHMQADTNQQTKTRQDWRSFTEQVRSQMRTVLESERQMDGTPLPPAAVIAALDEYVDADAIIALDTGDHTLWFNRIFRAQDQQLLYSGKWRTMGVALPAAIAAKLNNPNRQVVAVVGDGGLAMSMMELATIVRYQLPIIVLILNNHRLALEEHKMIQEGYAPFGTGLTNPFFDEVAKAHGMAGFRVQTRDALEAALQQARMMQQPTCIDVDTAPEVIPMMGNI